MSVSLTLQERLKQKHKEQQESMESLTQEQLSILRNELRNIFQAELNTIKIDMQLQLQNLALEIDESKNQAIWRVIKGRILFPALTAVTVLATICLSGSAYLHWQINQLVDNQNGIDMQKETLLNMESRTFGIDLKKDQNGTFVVLPEGSSMEQGWTVGSRQAIKVTR